MSILTNVRESNSHSLDNQSKSMDDITQKQRDASQSSRSNLGISTPECRKAKSLCNKSYFHQDLVAFSESLDSLCEKDAQKAGGGQMAPATLNQSNFSMAGRKGSSPSVISQRGKSGSFSDIVERTEPSTSRMSLETNRQKIVDKYTKLCSESKNTLDAPIVAKVETHSTVVTASKAKRREEERIHEQKLQKRWLKVHSNYKKYIINKTSKLRSYVYEGIALSLTGIIWKSLLNIPEFVKDKPDMYREWKTEALVNSAATEQIDKDIHRTFKKHSVFKIGYGARQASLFNVLVTYSYVDNEIGYTQGMNELAALLIMYMPEEDAFWSFLTLINGSQYKLRGFYGDNLPLLKIFNNYVREFMKIKQPTLLKHLDDTGYDVNIVTTKWIMCLFVQHLPLNYLLRVWSVIILEGAFVLVPICVTLLSYYKSDIIKKDMEGVANFFQSDTVDVHYKIESIMQEIKKDYDEFSKCGLKDKLNVDMQKCCSGGDSLALNAIRSFEQNIKIDLETNYRFLANYTPNDLAPNKDQNLGDTQSTSSKKSSGIITRRSAIKSNDDSLSPDVDGRCEDVSDTEDDLQVTLPPTPTFCPPLPVVPFKEFQESFFEFVKTCASSHSTRSLKSSIRDNRKSNDPFLDVFRLMNGQLDVNDTARLVYCYQKNSTPKGSYQVNMM